MAMRYHDNNGEPFEIKTGREDDIHRLMEMYTTFEHRGHYQGIPPKNLPTCLAWATHLLKVGDNFLALRGEPIIGHAALLSDLALRDGEYLVFVHQNHRGQGIGTALTCCAIAEAKKLGLREIWLTVDTDNFVAIRLYRKCGFCFSSGFSFERERKMILPLIPDAECPEPPSAPGKSNR